MEKASSKIQAKIYQAYMSLGELECRKEKHSEILESLKTNIIGMKAEIAELVTALTLAKEVEDFNDKQLLEKQKAKQVARDVEEIIADESRTLPGGRTYKAKGVIK